MYLNPTIQYFWQAKVISKKVGNVNILTVVAFWLAFFGLDTSQNCWICPPSWNEILIVAFVLKDVPQDLILISSYLIYYLGLLFGHYMF